MQRFPLIVKPVAEGTSKGVTAKSVVHDEAELREVARELVAKYRQPALVEQYIAGREFTVGLLGERRPRVLPPMEIVFLDTSDPDARLLLRHEAGVEQAHPLRGPGEASRRGSSTGWSGRRGSASRRSAAATWRASTSAWTPRAGSSSSSRTRSRGWRRAGATSSSSPQAAGISYRDLIGEILSFAIRRYQERERERERARRAAVREAAGGNGVRRREAPVGDGAPEAED